MTFLEFEADVPGKIDEKYKFLVQLAAIQVVEPAHGDLRNWMCTLQLVGSRDQLYVYGSYEAVSERIFAAQQAIV